MSQGGISFDDLTIYDLTIYNWTIYRSTPPRIMNCALGPKGRFHRAKRMKEL